MIRPTAPVPRVASMPMPVSFVGFAFGGIEKGLLLLRRDSKNDGRFTA